MLLSWEGVTSSTRSVISRSVLDFWLLSLDDIRYFAKFKFSLISSYWSDGGGVTGRQTSAAGAIDAPTAAAGRGEVKEAAFPA